jgi:hypothetical protein
VPPKASIGVKVDGSPLAPKYVPTLQSVEVELGVYKQAILRLKFAIGQDPTGDFAGWAESVFKPMTSIQIDAQIADKSQRLLNGLLTEFKMNLRADPCESQLELVGADSLEKVKRSTDRHSYPSHTLQAVVSTVLQRQGISPPASGVPQNGAANPTRDILMQCQNDLELLRKLADQNKCDVYVEPDGDTDQGHFEPLDLQNSPTIDSQLVANNGSQSHIRSASFFYDLSGPTAIEGQFIGKDGKPGGSPVRVDLRDALSDKDKQILGPPGFANVVKLDRHGLESRDQLKYRCEAELEKHSWVVVGKGELDSSLYGDFLLPRRQVKVIGVSNAFSGSFLVWDVTHSFTRDLYCQRFEVRRKLGVN